MIYTLDEQYSFTVYKKTFAVTTSPDIDGLTLETQYVLEMVDALLCNVSPEYRLSDVQLIVLRDTWEGKSYQRIASYTGYQVGYIKQIGSNLWQILSVVMAEKVSKKNLHSVIRRYLSRQRFENQDNT